MYPTRKIFIFLLLINLNGFFLFESSFVSAGFAFDLYAGSIRKLIEASTWLKVPKPLTFFTASAETANVNLTKQSIDLKLIDSVTVATMTGGVLGSDLYELYKYQLFWQKDTCNTTHNLDSAVFYYNLKYGSYEKALEEPGAVVVIRIPIATTGDFPNPKFDVFAKVIQANIHSPGCWAKVSSIFTYSWFTGFPYGSIYESSKQKMVDTETGKKFIATVIDLPFDPRTNYMSKNQYDATFGKIKGASGQSLDSILIPDGAEKTTERHQGVCVLYIPA